MPIWKNKIDRFLQLLVDRGSSDMHLAVGLSPMFRLYGEIDPIRFKILSNMDFVSLMRPIIPSDAYWNRLMTTGDLDFSYEVPSLARFRVNCFLQENGFGAVFRVIPNKILTLPQLDLPQSISRVCNLERGLVLVTGPTGSGKSTTLAALMDIINEQRPIHIITIEDPIEFVHSPKRAVITQREIGTHAPSFSEALKAAVREDPDLVLVGEMRDMETISLALNASAAGLLVFGTLHTNNAAKTIDRIVTAFPTDEHDGIRNILGEALQCIISQQLLKKISGGRAAAVEVMFREPALPTLIKEGKTHQLPSYIQSGRHKGMINMDESLLDLMTEGIVEEHDAYEKAIDKTEFRKYLKNPPKDDVDL